MSVGVFAVFGVDETMHAPVLNPLIASLAPSGMVDTTLGIFAALQTGVSAVGPLLARVALSGGHGSLFMAVHVRISLVAVFAALRSRALLRGVRVSQLGAMAATLHSWRGGDRSDLPVPQAA